MIFQGFDKRVNRQINAFYCLKLPQKQGLIRILQSLLGNTGILGATKLKNFNEMHAKKTSERMAARKL